MRDIPMFTTEHGVASLVLREIPYQAAAYVTIQDSLEPGKLLQECVSFCRACGADAVYAKGHPLLEQYEPYSVLVEMRCAKQQLPETEASLFPVQEHTLKDWLRIYREKIQQVPNGAWMTDHDGRKMIESGEGYFVHRNGKLLGIGKVAGNCIEWIASVQHGAGADVLCALADLIQEETVCLTVAYQNEKAMKLYSGLGFVPVREISRWYRVDEQKKNR